MNISAVYDRYTSFEELKAHEKDSYNIDYHEEAGSDCLIFSPHGGRIEGGSASLSALLTMIFQRIYLKGEKLKTIRICTLQAQILMSLWQCKK